MIHFSGSGPWSICGVNDEELTGDLESVTCDACIKKATLETLQNIQSLLTSSDKRTGEVIKDVQPLLDAETSRSLAWARQCVADRDVMSIAHLRKLVEFFDKPCDAVKR